MISSYLRAQITLELLSCNTFRSPELVSPGYGSDFQVDRCSALWQSAHRVMRFKSSSSPCWLPQLLVVDVKILSGTTDLASQPSRRSACLRSCS